MDTEVVSAPFHVCGGEGYVERISQHGQIFEVNLFLKVLGACGYENALAAEDRRNQIGERFAGAGARFNEQHAAIVQRTRHGIRHVALGGTRLERRQRFGERSRVGEDLGDSVAQAPYSGNIRHSFSTSAFTMPSAASSSGVVSARVMSSPTLSISRSPMPRVVTAGVPIRMPLAVIGGFGANGMAFLLTVMPA